MKSYVLALQDNEAVINTTIVMAAATGIIKNHDSNLLKYNGGHIEITKYWALSSALASHNMSSSHLTTIT